MILQFKAKNILSIRDEQTLDFTASTDNTYEEYAVVKIKNVRISKLGVIYGPNASGKSNILKALYWLFQFVPRPQKFEFIVRQATECGISTIVPIDGEYSEKSSVAALQGSKRERLDRIIKEARQQSGSPVDTRVLEPVSLEKAVELWNEACGGTGDGENSGTSVAFVLSERDDCSGNLRAMVQKSGGFEKIKRAAIAVGSEGGVSPEEVKLLEEKGLFVPVHFAVNILRCETAALYGIAAVQSEINSSK